MANFFIRRPIVAIVIAIITVLLGLIFLTVTPCWVTSWGRRDWAEDTRFWVRTFDMSWSTPTWKLTSSCMRPSEVFDDFM